MTVTPGALPSEKDSQPLSPQAVIKQAIETHYSSLQIGVRVLVARSGLVDGYANIAEMGDEVFQYTVETALRIAARFDPSHQAQSWLLGIAANKIKEIRRKNTHETNHTQIIESEENRNKSEESDGDIENYTAEERIDAAVYHSTHRDSLEDSSPMLNELLSLVDDNDRRILTLAYVDQLSGVDIAAALGIREGAAYVRVARAKERLRKKYLTVLGKKEL